jgi:hypothetical protein
MRKITVRVDDETFRRASTKAAARGTSLSALIGGFLADFAPAESERLKRLEEELRGRIPAFNAGDRLSRDDLYQRKPRLARLLNEPSILD